MSTPPPISRAAAEPASAAPTAAGDRPSRRRLAYAVGGVLDQWGAHGVKNTANPVLNLVLGVNPAAVGTLMALARLWDGVTDPVMGSVSDGARTRWGRRRPFIAAGAVASALSFVVLWWMPTSLTGTAQLLWLTIAVLVFYSAYTVFTVPYNALGYELEPGYHGKTRLFALRTICTVATSFAVAWIFPLTQNGMLGDPVQSVRLLAVIVAAVLLVVGLLPAFLVREPRSVASVQTTPRVPFFASLRSTVSCQPFVLLLAAAGGTLVGNNLVNALGTYVNVYHVHGGDAPRAALVGGFAGTVYGIAVLASTPVMTWLAARLGKSRTLFWCLILGAVTSASKWWLFDPAYPWAQLVVSALFAPPTAGLGLLGAAMVADVCEFERHRSGRRIEAMFAAVFSWVQKSCLALGVFGSGWILVGAGFDVAHGADQSASTLTTLRLAFAIVPCVFALAAAALIRRYPLDAARMYAIRRELDARDAAPPFPSP